MDPTQKKEAQADGIFERYLKADSSKSIVRIFQELCDSLELDQVKDRRVLYDRLSSGITSWRAQAVWSKLNKRKSLEVYKNGTACSDKKVLIIGAGPVGLRTAIEASLLGCQVVVIDKRDAFSRNNVLQLWPFVVTDLRNIGAKDCFAQFCVGGIDHISIRQLQLILMKISLLLGVEIHTDVSFEGLVEPSTSEKNVGWRCKCIPEDHVVSKFEFDVVFGAEGRRTSLKGFTRKEYRAKLAIAVTANFVRKYSKDEAKVPELGGYIQYGRPEFFKELKDQFEIDLENVVYFKDETHYVVMTAKKESLLKKGVIKSNKSSAVDLLRPSNIDSDALKTFAKRVVQASTNNELPDLEFCMNHKNEPDVAMFDFTSMYYSENASYAIERNGHTLLLGLVGDSLLEPFWPQGTGCSRGFLSAFDAAWMIRQWSKGDNLLDVICERESIYTSLSKAYPSSLKPLLNDYTIDPSSRYKHFTQFMANRLRADQVKRFYESERTSPDNNAKEQIISEKYVFYCESNSFLDKARDS